jgi:hypothetical protein
MLLSFARVAVIDSLSRDPRMAQQEASAAIEGKKCPYFLHQKYVFFRDPRKRFAFLASDAV